MRLAWIVLLVLPLSARAQPDSTTWRLTVHGPSWHGTSEYRWNENTWGLGLEYDHQWRGVSWGVIGGGYYNSVYAGSFYFALALQGPSQWPVKLGAAAGIVTGYDVPLCQPEVRNGKHVTVCYAAALSPVMPVVWPAIIIGNRIQARLMAWPLRGGVLHGMLSIRL